MRRTSSSSVRQLETEIRIAGRPFQTVGLIQASPSCCTAATICGVRSSLSNRSSTWLSTTSLTISQPGSAASPSAIATALAQLPSIISASPFRPSERIAAHAGSERARRENSGL